MFLTPDELAELTDRKFQSGQVQWLREHGVPYVLSAIGRPKVLREEVEKRLLSKPRRKVERGARLELVQ